MNTPRRNQEPDFSPVRVSAAKAPHRMPSEGPEHNHEHCKHLITCARAGRKDAWSPMGLAYRNQTVAHMAALAARNKVVAESNAKQQRILS